MKLLRAAVGVTFLLAVWLPALAQDGDDLPAIEAELARLRAESEELSEEYQKAWAADAELQTRIRSLETSIAAYWIDLGRLRDQIRERAVHLYMDGATANDLASFFLSATPTVLDTRSEYLWDLRRQDQAMFNNLDTLTRQLETSAQELRSEKQQQELVLARLEQLAVDLSERLEEGQAAYALIQQRQAEERARREAEERARREAERQAEEERLARRQEAARAATTTTAPAVTTTSTVVETTAPPEETTPTTTEAATTTTSAPAATTTTAAPATTTPINVTDTTFANPTTSPPEGEGAELPGGMACPVDGFSTFSDTWGAPRSGGRSHKGVDLLAARGTPVAAVESGYVERMRRSGLGGITVWLQGASGDDYYYAHLDAWAPGLSVGQEVSVGQHLGVVGTTGNSPDHIPHLHWEHHPDGYRAGAGTAVNPTPLARRLCG